MSLTFRLQHPWDLGLKGSRSSKGSILKGKVDLDFSVRSLAQQWLFGIQAVKSAWRLEPPKKG